MDCLIKIRLNNIMFPILMSIHGYKDTKSMVRKDSSMGVVVEKQK